MSTSPKDSTHSSHEAGHHHTHQHGRITNAFLKPFGLIKNVFKHDHSGGRHAGALAVEGPDDVGHIGSGIPSLVREINDTHRKADTLASFTRETGTPLNAADAGASLGVNSILSVLGLYTLIVSAQEVHETGHHRKELREKLHNIRQRYQNIKDFTSQDYASIQRDREPDREFFAYLQERFPKIDSKKIGSFCVQQDGEGYTITPNDVDGKPFKKCPRTVVPQSDITLNLIERVSNHRTDLSEQTSSALKAQSDALGALVTHLESDLKQNKRDLWFWRSSAASGGIITAKGTADLATISLILKNTGTPTALAAGTAGGITTAALGPLMGTAALGVGGAFTRSAYKQRKHARELKPVVLRHLEGEADQDFKEFVEKTFQKRETFNTRRVRWGSAFTTSSALSLTGALVGSATGAGIGALLAPATMGTSIPACALAGGIIGLVGGAGAISSVWILPYGHLKNARYKKYEQEAHAEESSLLAAANILKPGIGSKLLARQFQETRDKHKNFHACMQKIAEQQGKKYTPKAHKSDPSQPGQETTQKSRPSLKNIVHRNAVTEKDIYNWINDPKNSSAACNFMLRDIAVDLHKESYLRQKSLVRQKFHKNLEGINADQLSKCVFPDAFFKHEQAEKQKLQDLETLQKEIQSRETSPQRSDSTMKERLEKFLKLKGCSSEKIDKDVYKAFSQYMREEPKNDRDARGEIFASLEWIAQTENQSQPATPRIPTPRSTSPAPSILNYTAREDARIAEEWLNQNPPQTTTPRMPTPRSTSPTPSIPNATRITDEHYTIEQLVKRAEQTERRLGPSER